MVNTGNLKIWPFPGASSACQVFQVFLVAGSPEEILDVNQTKAGIAGATRQPASAVESKLSYCFVQATQAGKFIPFYILSFIHLFGTILNQIDRCRQASLFLSLLILSALQAALGP